MKLNFMNAKMSMSNLEKRLMNSCYLTEEAEKWKLFKLKTKIYRLSLDN